MSEITQAIFDEGELKGKIEMVLKMLKTKQALQFISEMSDFTVEKIREIARQNGITIAE